MYQKQDTPICQCLRFSIQFADRVGNETFEMGVPLRAHATMGLPDGRARCSPNRYLRKDARELRCNRRSRHLRFSIYLITKIGFEWNKNKTKPPLPPQNERPLMGLVTDKNYVTTNALATILSKPVPIPEPKRWTDRKGFGKVPSYLKNVSPAESEPSRSRSSPQVLNAIRRLL